MLKREQDLGFYRTQMEDTWDFALGQRDPAVGDGVHQILELCGNLGLLPALIVQEEAEGWRERSAAMSLPIVPW